MKNPRPPTRALSLAFAIMLSWTHARCDDSSPAIRLDPVYLGKVAETTALGFVNGPKIVASSSGTIVFSLSTLHNGVAPQLVVYRARQWGAGGVAAERLVITDTAATVVSGSPHIAQSKCALQNKGPAHLMWSGGNRAETSDPAVAHQIRYARIALRGPLKVLEQSQPFSVTGFSRVYQPPFGVNTPWQENPAAAVTAEGTLHVVWEARDRHRIDSNLQPIPAIAYATRRAKTGWSVPATFDAPIYLQTTGLSAMQRRPILLTAGGYPIHVLCYGDVHGTFQILYGQITVDGFSGWSEVAPSANDQRQVTATLDDAGRVHAMWREAPGDDASFLSYSVRAVDGKWSAPLPLGDDDVYESAPSLTVVNGRVIVAWTGWDLGFVNSDSQQNNNSPNDEDTVEGNLYVSEMPVAGTTFSQPALLTGGTCSYPTLTRLGSERFGSPLLIWTAGQECLPNNCVQLYLSTLRTARK